MNISVTRIAAAISITVLGSFFITGSTSTPTSRFAPYRQTVIDVNTSIQQEYQMLKKNDAKLEKKEKVKDYICSRMLEEKQEDCNILIDMYHDEYVENGKEGEEVEPIEIKYDDVIAQKQVFQYDKPEDKKHDDAA